MKRLSLLLLGTCLSVALYLTVFTVVERPLTLGDLQQQLDFKLSYSRSLKSPKVMIFAGSNGRFSHRCEEISAAVGLPCVNASIATGVGMDFLLDQFDPTLNPGDLVYMPLEYTQYNASENDMHLGVQNAVMLRSRREYLLSLPVRRVVEAYGAFDLPYLVRGLAEMTLAHRKFKRRSGIDTLTPQGDERDHTPAMAQPYASYLRQAAAPDTRVVADAYAQHVLAAFLVRARTRGIVVAGGLPTVPDDTAIDPNSVGRIRDLYLSNGQFFVSNATASRYPRSCLYDTVYHLNEDCQIRHSRVVGALLRQMLDAR
jgi:hypothetical protein